MTSRLPPLCLLPLALLLNACGGGSSNDESPTASSGEQPPAGPPLVEIPPTDQNPPPPEPDPQRDTNPFQTPDASAATVLERRGYRDATAEADDLVSTAYLDDYRTIAEQLPLLAEGIELGTKPVERGCPQGGSALLSRLDGADDRTEDELRYLFDGCAMDTMTLDGQLEQRLTRGGSRINPNKALASRFDALAMILTDGTRIQVDGTAEDSESSTSLPTCGPVQPVVLARKVTLAAASIDSPADGTTRLSNVVYRADDEDRFKDRGACDREQRVSFAGSATATLASELGGEVSVRLSKTGELLRNDEGTPPGGSQAKLIATASDGSSLTVTATDDAAGLAQFDLQAGDAVVSFIDTYTFEP